VCDERVPGSIWGAKRYPLIVEAARKIDAAQASMLKSSGWTQMVRPISMP